ncbi:MAG: adenylate/guanylate cyclase domain-containing protein, partial [Pseudomonadota bacterium]
MKRRLATVLAADIVGFSRLMHADESGTYHRVTETIDQVKALLEARAGRVFKVMGDGVMAEFESVRLAVVAALEVQELLAEEDGPDAIKLRIGINLGDVIAHGDDLYGDGVNIAARVEALAPVGGILCTRPVRDQIRDHLQLDIEDQGEARVKNIRRPIRVFRVSRSTVTRNVAEPLPRKRPKWRAQIAAVAALALLALLLSEHTATPPPFGDDNVAGDDAAASDLAALDGGATGQSVLSAVPPSPDRPVAEAVVLPALEDDGAEDDGADFDQKPEGLLQTSVTGVVDEETLAALDVVPVLEAPPYSFEAAPVSGAGRIGLNISFDMTGT